MKMLDALKRPESTERAGAINVSTFQEYVDWFTFQSKQYGLAGSAAMSPGNGFASYVDAIHRVNPVVSAAAVSRAMLMSQVRPVWRNNAVSNTPGRTFGSRDLELIERPGAMSRSAFFALMEYHVSYSGSAYPVRKNGRLYLLRPDWVTVVMGSNSAPESDRNLPPSDAAVMGLLYQPEHGGQKGDVEVFLPGEFGRYTPEPDPVHWWRGVSWVSALVRETSVDGQVLDHQSKYFEHAATPNMVLMMSPDKSPTEVEAFAKVFNQKFAGVDNAYKNWFLGGGTDVKVVGSTLENLALRDVAGGIESRISSRSMVPAVVLGVRESMQGSALNSGNYSQTRRLWADKWYTPAVDALCEALEPLFPRKDDAYLSWDRGAVMFLQEDEKDAAEIAQVNATAMRQLVDGGFDPKSVVDAVTTNDLTKLVHTGNVSVQLQPPGTSSDD